MILPSQLSKQAYLSSAVTKGKKVHMLKVRRTKIGHFLKPNANFSLNLLQKMGIVHSDSLFSIKYPEFVKTTFCAKKYKRIKRVWNWAIFGENSNFDIFSTFWPKILMSKVLFFYPFLPKMFFVSLTKILSIFNIFFLNFSL